MMERTARRYVLSTYRVECTSKGWVYCPLGREKEKDAWSHPYMSIASVTLMIARQLRKEVERRDTRSPPH